MNGRCALLPPVSGRRYPKGVTEKMKRMRPFSWPVLALGLVAFVPLGRAQEVMQLSLKRAVDIALTPEGSARVAQVMEENLRQLILFREHLVSLLNQHFESPVDVARLKRRADGRSEDETSFLPF